MRQYQDFKWLALDHKIMCFTYLTTAMYTEDFNKMLGFIYNKYGRKDSSLPQTGTF